MNNTQKDTVAVNNAAIMADQKIRADQRVKQLCAYIVSLELPLSANKELLRLIAEHVVATEADALARGFHMGAECVVLLSKTLQRWIG